MNHLVVHLKLTQYCKSAKFQYKIKIKLKKESITNIEHEKEILS